MKAFNPLEAPPGYIAVEVPPQARGEDCKLCCFRENTDCSERRCHRTERKDGRSVFFVQMPDEYLKPAVTP